jgi:hypothetical protein
MADNYRMFSEVLPALDAEQQAWADTCSKPRVGEFSGGGVFVTAAGVRFLTPQDWLDQLQAEFRAQSSVLPRSQLHP